MHHSFIGAFELLVQDRDWIRELEVGPFVGVPILMRSFWAALADKLRGMDFLGHWQDSSVAELVSFCKSNSRRHFRRHPPAEVYGLMPTKVEVVSSGSLQISLQTIGDEPIQGGRLRVSPSLSSPWMPAEIDNDDYASSFALTCELKKEASSTDQGSFGVDIVFLGYDFCWSNGNVILPAIRWEHFDVRCWK